MVAEKRFLAQYRNGMDEQVKMTDLPSPLLCAGKHQ